MVHTSHELDALIAATARQDRSAFRTLYDRTAAKLFGVVLRIVRDRSLAEDVLQDVYLRVWQGAGSYSAEAGRPMTWLISVARHRAIDAIRSRSPTAALVDADGHDALPSLSDGRDREAEFATADTLARCLAQLDGTQRECLLAAYGEGLSREDLARRYDRPVNTIKTWLHRSARELQRCLDAPT